ncbi:carboxymuconolactone decarboxylase family protein [Brevibacterium sp. FME37]|uniref:carboxymuconolactone decarboxylase family protein n=1 Tax=Brevibacterium sp. FME37 TaxID=2742607 RepID=UPI001867277B|nr:carboxymuconolactone decarboxylase family protein [Brevibacterium sp. FME37]
MSRLEINKHAPEGYQIVMELDAYLRNNIDPVLLDFVKLRSSQINECAFCVDMHATGLEKLGVPARKIYAVSAWKEVGFFTLDERAALALTEQLTRLPGGVDDAIWEEAAEVFSERQLSDVILAAGTINLLNRMGVGTKQAPPRLKSN